MSTRKHVDLIAIATRLHDELRRNGIPFKADGYPDLTSFDYPQSLPDGLEIWPYEKRHQARNKAKTLLVFFTGDDNLYNYLNQLDQTLASAHEYYAVAGFDLSPCVNDTIEEQQMALLLNALVNAHFMLNGVKVIPTTRTGSLATIHSLRSYPQGICFAIGVLGCRRKDTPSEEMLFRLKLMTIRPTQLAIYGVLNTRDTQMLDEYGIPYVSQEDYRTRRFSMSLRRAA